LGGERGLKKGGGGLDLYRFGLLMVEALVNLYLGKVTTPNEKSEGEI